MLLWLITLDRTAERSRAHDRLAAIHASRMSRYRRREKGRHEMHMHPLNEWMMDQLSKARREQFMAEAAQETRARACTSQHVRGDVRRRVGAAMIRAGYRVAGQSPKEWAGTDSRLPLAG